MKKTTFTLLRKFWYIHHKVRVATSITIDSGGSAGMATAVSQSHFISLPEAYATLGVGAFLAAVTRAPLIGMFLMLEMTQDE
ncbi:MAG: chloride channel protein [Nitrospirae bacterium]|nr:chloride channel protein [Nitrospirota bacterium]